MEGNDVSLPPTWKLIPCLGDTSCARQVRDADEEVFYLYTITAAPTGRVGLGQVDSSHDLLSLSVRLQSEGTRDVEIIVQRADEAEYKAQKSASKSSSSSSSSIRKSRGSRRVQATQNDRLTTTVVLRQDSTSLKSTNGDTGSVVWRSSVYLAAKILADLSVRKRTDETPSELFSTSRLLQSTVLELGAGTGVLPAVLFSRPDLLQDLSAKPMSSSGALRWLATDQEAIFGLLERNMRSTQAYLTDSEHRVEASVLDWFQASQVWQNAAPSSLSLARYRDQLFSGWEKTWSRSSTEQEEHNRPDLIIATDCIFNAHLLQPLLHTLALFAVPNHTLVLVVCELREPELIRELLELWLSPGSRGEQWCIVALQTPEEAGEDEERKLTSSTPECALGYALEKGSVGWVAWRVK